MSENATPTPNETLEATVARLVAGALRACGGPLALREVSMCNASQNSATGGSMASVESASKEQGLVLSDHVISTKVLDSVPSNTSVICIGPKAVVTPAAKDWLRHRKIQAVRIDKAQQVSIGLGGQTPSPPNITLVDTAVPERGLALQRQLSLRGLVVDANELESLRRNCQANPRTFGLIVSALPAIDVDWAGRCHAMRAAVVDSVESVRRTASRFQPQIWVLDADRLTLSGLVSVAETCIRTTEVGR
jgi:hypothetical protein